jgi:hypothetical protein
MKKQIALLATLIAASGFTAFGQDWMEITAEAPTYVWNEIPLFTSGTSLEAATGTFDVVYLWAASSSADQLSAVGQLSNMGANNATPKQQVATNGVVSVTPANSTALLSSMLSGSWSVINNENSGAGSAAAGQAIIANGSKGQIPAYNGGSSFQVNGVSVGSGSTIEMLALAVNTSAIVSGSLVVGDITQMGWSNPFNESVGTSQGDPNANGTENGTGGMNQFGVTTINAVPEPTTLALAGLGGLSMLFLRRRKA